MPDSELIFESRRFNIRRRQLRGSDNVQRDYDFVVHPGAAVILPLLADDQVLLIRNHRPAINAELLELPAGTLEPGEPPVECARRELTEETGFTAAQVAPLIEFYSTPGFCTERLYVFVATGLTPGDAAPDPGERIKPAPMAYEAALAAVRDGRIIDGKSIATLLYYARFGSRGSYAT